jgi:hypothetical protein
MSTWISMLKWSGDPEPSPAEVRAAIAPRATTLRRRGLHSLVFLRDEGECSAVMIATCNDERDAARLAADVLPRASVEVESMRFEDASGRHALSVPPLPRDYRHSLLAAVGGDG